MTFSSRLDMVIEHIVGLLYKMHITEGAIAVLAPPDLDSAFCWEGQAFSPVFFEREKDIKADDFSAVVVLNLAYFSGKAVDMQSLQQICEKSGIPLIIAAQNFSHNSIRLPQLFGQIDYNLLDKDGADFAIYTAGALDEITQKSGFVFLNENDILIDYCNEPNSTDNTLVSQFSLANQYFSWLRQRGDSSASIWCFVRAYTASAFVPEKSVSDNETRPFLSVVTRTQGKRLGKLKETLLCLSAQNDRDFELLILGHKVTDENKKSILDTIEEFPASFRSRVRYFDVNAGNRSAPLNFGISQAKGQYISFLDDDDLVMDNWVEAFHRQALDTPGTLLHAYSVSQAWRSENNDECLCALEKPKNIYCKPFDYISQLVENSCPNMSLSFPAWIFQKTNINFDETLDTTEDWNTIMIVSNIIGVSDIPKITSIYRLWENSESSYSLYTQDLWTDNYNVIKQRLNKMPVLLPPGYARVLDRYHKVYLDYKQNIGGSADATRAVLYVSLGDGFCEENTIFADNLDAGACFWYKYVLSGEYQKVTDIRFDPMPNGEFVLCDLKIRITTLSGKTIPVAMNKIGSNGFLFGDEICFWEDDPQIFFSNYLREDITRVEVQGRIEAPVPQIMRKTIRENYTSTKPFFQRVIGKIRRILLRK